MKTRDSPQLDLWRELYSAAGRIKDLSPWTFMKETDVFGVRDPLTGKIAFVSVMGICREHFAVTLYPDAKTMAAFWKIQDTHETAEKDSILEMPQIQVAFGDRNSVKKEDLKVIRGLGLKFRGELGWPVFRSYRAGYIPWFLETEEIRILTLALEQTLDVAPRFQADPNLLPSGRRTQYLVRSSQDSPKGRIWTDEQIEIAFPPEPASIHYSDENMLSAVGKLARAGNIFEADLFSAIMQIGLKGKRPQYPYLLLSVDCESLYIVSLEILTVDTTIPDMRLQAADKLFQGMVKVGMRPSEIRLRSDTFAEIIRSACEQCGIRLNLVNRLPCLEKVRRDLTEELHKPRGPNIGS